MFWLVDIISNFQSKMVIMSKAEGKFSAICQVNSIQFTSTREASWDAVHGN